MLPPANCSSEITCEFCLSRKVGSLSCNLKPNCIKDAKVQANLGQSILTIK